MKKLLDLGDHYVSDFVKTQTPNRPKFNLDLYADPAIGAPRLKSQPPHSSMWGQYWYRSGINASMTNELRGIVAEIVGRVKLKAGDVWLDIACNDGTLLKAVPDHVTKLGIDPCDDTFYAESSRVAKVNQTYFTKDAFDEISDVKAKVITCIAMFYDLSDPAVFVKDLFECLDDDGTLILQMSYTPLMLQQLAFDNICHEHVYYYDLTSITRLFSQHGFKSVDCAVNDTNGGSFRVYIQKITAKESSFGSAPLRDVCRYRVNSIFQLEKTAPLNDEYTWAAFGARLDQFREVVVGFVRNARAEGKTVYGYGASTKGNTLLQYFGLTDEDIVAIAERSPAKFGLRTVGTDIPIISEEEMRAARPDYLLVLPWHFIDEFQQRESEFLQRGGKFIVPCPTFKIIGS